MIRGKFITLEGGEGTGKTTNLKFLATYLTGQGLKVTVTREPGGTKVAETLRELVLADHDEPITETAELLLMFAARAQHIDQVIEPALSNGSWVLCDRFTDASYAYQGGGRQLNSSPIAWLEQFVQGSLKPDLTLLFDAPVDTCLERLQQRGKKNRFDAESTAFMERVRRAYLVQAKLAPQRMAVIAAERPLAEVQNQLLGAIQPLLHGNVRKHRPPQSLL
ncbi:MAG: dTMP kinase [Methylococcales bacterium]|nr:dTMP kinase [Methylococcales bacterium]